MSSSLIQELKNDHAVIEEMLTQAKAMNISDNQAREMLISAKARLISHLKKEDSELYPTLYKSSLTNPALKLTLDFYARDIERISTDTMHFLDKYSNGGSGIEFARDFGKFFTTLSTRIRDEEKTIYKEYEKLNG